MKSKEIVSNEFFVHQNKELKRYGFMKKDLVLTVRVESDMKTVIQGLAQEDDRTVAWILRKLITEALEARKLWPIERDDGGNHKYKD